MEIGEGVTQVVPVFDGYSLSYAQQRIDLGGRDVTEHLNLLLRRSGYTFHTSVRRMQCIIIILIPSLRQSLRSLRRSRRGSASLVWLVRLKIRSSRRERSRILLVFPMVVKSHFPSRSPEQQRSSSTLPSSVSSIHVTYTKRESSSQLLSHYASFSSFSPAVSELLIRSIQKVDIDLRNTLYQELVISGGCTKLKDFPTRFVNEVKKSIPKAQKVWERASQPLRKAIWIIYSVTLL